MEISMKNFSKSIKSPKAIQIFNGVRSPLELEVSRANNTKTDLSMLNDVDAEREKYAESIKDRYKEAYLTHVRHIGDLIMHQNHGWNLPENAKQNYFNIYI